MSAPPETAESEIAESVNQALENGSVLLLVSGGSNIQLAVQIRNRLTLKNTLSIGLIDERYGPVGHPDSNWAQLLEAGLDTDGIKALPVLNAGQSHIEAAADYQERLKQAASEHSRVIGIFGMGTDGHTAGILPGSPAATTNALVNAFRGPDFQRITITPAAMRLFDEAFLVSYGAAKHPQLARLIDDIPVTEQPVQALKHIDNLIIYTDYQVTED